MRRGTRPQFDCGRIPAAKYGKLIESIDGQHGLL